MSSLSLLVILTNLLSQPISIFSRLKNSMMFHLSLAKLRQGKMGRNRRMKSNEVATITRMIALMSGLNEVRQPTATALQRE